MSLIVSLKIRILWFVYRTYLNELVDLHNTVSAGKSIFELRDSHHCEDQNYSRLTIVSEMSLIEYMVKM
jgi:hypothetical protein